MFLHIRVLKLTHMLGQREADCSEYMNDILSQDDGVLHAQFVLALE